MSREAFVKFIKMLSDDTTLHDEILEVAEGSGDAAVVPTEKLVEIAKTRGLEFTVEEALGTIELSDDELDAVSGGVHPPERGLRKFGSFKIGQIEGMAIKIKH